MGNLRTYAYWAEPASVQDNEQLARQITLSMDYRRMLADIENASRNSIRELDKSDPVIGPLLEQVVAVLKDEARRGELAELKKQLSSARSVVRKTDEWKAAARAISDVRSSSVRAARSEISDRGLYWGTYLIVEESIEAAARTTPVWEDVKLAFHPGSGTIAIQIQSPKPLRADDVHGEDTRLRVGSELYGLGYRQNGFRAPCEPGVRRKGGGGAAKLRSFWIRTGTEEGKRTAIWTKFHLLMHRPLPRGAQIRWVRVHQTRLGIEKRWSVQFIIDLEAAPSITRPMPAARVAGVDLGWRKLESGGMRVAMVVGSDNQRHELVVPLAVHQRQGKSDDLRSIRDKRRDEMKKKIASWRETVTDEWFLAETAYAAQWLKIGRIASLHYQWRARRAEGHHFDGEIPIVEELSSWMKQDRHLIRWERFGVKKMRQQITKLYEQFAHTLCKQYGRIALEDMDLVTVRKRLVDSDESWMGDIANKRGSLLSLGELRETLRYTAAKYGTEIVDVNPAYTTQQCTSCDHVGELADAAAILSTCPKCGATQDQDIRAAINILKRSDELAAGEGQRQAKDLKLRARRTRKAAKPPATVTQGDTP